MKSVLMAAMVEEDHDKRSWKGTTWVAVFVVLSLAWQACGREQAALIRQIYSDTNDDAVLFSTIAVSIAQLVAIMILLKPETLRGELPNKEAIVILALSHVGYTFLHDFLSSMGNSQSSLPVAFCLPLFTLVTSWLVTAVSPRLSTWLSVLIICFGCTFVPLRLTAVKESDRTSLICGLASVTFILRNIVLRQTLYHEGGNVKTRSSMVTSTLMGGSVLVLIIVYFALNKIWFAPVLCALATSALAAGLALATCKLLQSYSVLFVSLFSVWALLLESLLLTPLSDRPDLVVCVVALTVVLIGHYLFLKDHVEHNAAGVAITPFAQKPVNVHEQYTRIEFFLFCTAVLGVIFYVFQPQVSQRDLKTLNFVGLDRVIRRLLSIPAQVPEGPDFPVKVDIVPANHS